MRKQIENLELWQKLVDFLAVDQPEMPEELRDSFAWVVAKHFAENPDSTVLDRLNKK